MNQTWPTKEQDMEIAYAIIEEYLEENERTNLGILEVSVDAESDEPLDIRVAGWIKDLVGHFRRKYGHEHGYAIVGYVITGLMLRNETIH